MRVIAGIAKGRPLKAVPGSGTRPTTDKVKEAIFSRIGPFFEGQFVLDLFAGTGGLGIEALSRGAEHAIFVDKEAASVQVVRHNIAQCGFESKTEIYRNAADRALKALTKREIRFDLVFLDPPYKLKWIPSLIELMDEYRLLSEEAQIVCEHPSEDSLPNLIGALHKTNDTAYGDTTVTLYKRKIEKEGES